MASDFCHQFLTRPRYRISLLLMCTLVLALPILLQERVYPNRWTSLQAPIAQPPDPAHLSHILFPGIPASEDRSWLSENERAMYSLFQCLEQANCGENQTKVVILAASPFWGLLRGENDGEAIWANSTLMALRRLGYSYLYSINQERTSQLYAMFRALVLVVVVDAPAAHECFHDEDCVLLGHKTHGIPAWKMLSWHFWDSPDHPLGRKWTLSPEDYQASAGNTYLGYSIEPQCSTQTFIPHAQRKPQAYVLAKEAKYFAPTDRAYSPESFDAASAAAGLQFLAGVRERALPEYFPRNVTNVGFMSSTRFYEVLAESRVLVGVGVPATSPTPYEALCLGVPFINPILLWNAEDPTNRTQWVAQHATLKFLDPPYVYNVFKGDEAGFVDAVVSASSHPIDSFVLEQMRTDAVEARVAAMVERDWKGEAVRLLAERQASGVGETFWL
ncbi:hypothetical protein B0H17DRAFT_991114 [Mycena rosella]|uniref:alpha-1,6-mannosyl-glycoprotein 6-beta-N-acetylglucosaminyltransferase n=1 Tax=Mycena rosella TaxID=1033263 RepID=A0AAD7G6M8_MYCRO|nr:hypothetical protein B0H17DRAFT_991114 [Mycena rosella]